MYHRYLLAEPTPEEVAETEGAFPGTMYEVCQQQPQAGFSLERAIRNQSQLGDVRIILMNNCQRPRPKKEEAPWEAAGELYCTVFSAFDSVGRPLNVRIVAIHEEWNHAWARHHHNYKEDWPTVQGQTGRQNAENFAMPR